MTDPTRAQLDQAILLLQQVQAHYPTTVQPVHAGDNLQSLVASAIAGTVFAPDRGMVWTGDLILPKPVTLLGGAIVGTIVCQAPEVTLRGLRLTGSQRDQNLLIAAADLLVEDCALMGSSAGCHRGILVNCRGVTIRRTTVANIWHDQDTQAIAGWDGTADLLIEDCPVLEASGENIIFGGADPTTVAGIPRNVTIRRCALTKPIAWRTLAGASCKNLFELKNIKGCLVEDVTMEYSYVDSQIGFGVLLNVRNQDGAAPFSTIEDVTMRRITLRHVAGGVSFLGSDYTHPSQTMKRVLLEDWTIEDLSSDWGVNQRTFQMETGAEDVTLRRITAFGPRAVNSIFTFAGTPWTRLTVEGCNVDEGYYGIHSSDYALGVKTLEHFAPGLVWRDNTVRTRRAETGRVIPYPTGTTIVPA